jgi:hypothetical protein
MLLLKLKAAFFFGVRRYEFHFSNQKLLNKKSKTLFLQYSYQFNNNKQTAPLHHA